MTTEITTVTLPMSVAYSHSLSDALYEAGCKSPSDFSIVQMSGGYGDCLIIHTTKALAVWSSVPKNHPDKCAVGYGAGTGMYIRD